MGRLFLFLLEYLAVLTLTVAVAVFAGDVLAAHLQMFLEHVFGPITHALGAVVSLEVVQHALA